jgi:hypothetical protein
MDCEIDWCMMYESGKQTVFPGDATELWSVATRKNVLVLLLSSRNFPSFPVLISYLFLHNFFFLFSSFTLSFCFSFPLPSLSISSLPVLPLLSSRFRSPFSSLRPLHTQVIIPCLTQSEPLFALIEIRPYLGTEQFAISWCDSHGIWCYGLLIHICRLVPILGETGIAQSI